MIRRNPTFPCLVGLLFALTPLVTAQELPFEIDASNQKRITLNVANGDIRNALRLVAEQGGLNLVIGRDVKGEVSVYLADASVKTALRAIARHNGFEFTLDDGVIAVSKPSAFAPGQAGSGREVPRLMTRIFTLRSQDAARVRDALEFALTKYGKMKVLNENSEPLYSTQRLSDLSGDFEERNNLNNGQGNRALQNRQGAAGAPGARLVGSRAGAKYARNARVLVVTDVKENVLRIAGLIADLDRLPPQVLIEARIVEMSTDLQRQLGVDWNVDVLANGPILNHELPLDFRAGFATGGQIRRGTDGTPNSSVGLALGSIDFTRFIGLLRIHQQDNAIRLLANPRLLVFNNHSASILVGERYPLLKSNITDQGTLTESFDTYIPIGIQLEVTPTVMLDGRISLLVHPVTSSLGDDIVGTTGLRVARINTRELDTRVIMSDGQTIVLGGLISDRKTRTVNKIPGLGDLPILSALFRQESPRAERVDLLIFLTVHVENSTELNERDREIYEMYAPHFKHIERLQDVPLYFEVPTEYESPRPMFGDPPGAETLGADRYEMDYEEADSPGGLAEQPILQETTSARANRSRPGQTSPVNSSAESPRLRPRVASRETYRAAFSERDLPTRFKTGMAGKSKPRRDAEARAAEKTRRTSRPDADDTP